MAVEQELLGQVIREEREKRRLSQEGLAALAGLSRTFVGEIERGVVATSLDSISQIAGGFGMKLSELLLEYERHLEQKH